MSQHSKCVFRFQRLGWFATATLVSAVAFGQAVGEPAPAAAPAAPAAVPAPAAAPAPAVGAPAEAPVVDSAQPAAGDAAAVPAVPRVAAPRAAPKKVAPKPAAVARPEPAPAARPAPPPAPAIVPAPAAVPPAAPPPVAHVDEQAPAVQHGHRHALASATAQSTDHEASQANGAHQAAHQESEEPPTFEDINWFNGLLGESDEYEPSLLYRPKGMPAPFLATLINWGILVSLIVMLAKKQLPAALAKRKATIVQGMDEAKKMRDESAARLREYEEKLAKIDGAIERIKGEMRKAGEQERDRILAEAVERRSRMERDALRLIDTELEVTKESLRREVVQVALSAAKQSIGSQVKPTDQQRLFDDAMASLRKLPARSLGGQA